MIDITVKSEINGKIKVRVIDVLGEASFDSEFLEKEELFRVSIAVDPDDDVRGHAAIEVSRSESGAFTPWCIVRPKGGAVIEVYPQTDARRCVVAGA